MNESQLREALQIGRDAAAQVAAEYHESMRGYRADEHARVDADVRKIEEALAALSAPTQQPVLGAELLTAISLLLRDVVTAKGMNSITTPDYAVRVAKWLSDAEATPAAPVLDCDNPTYQRGYNDGQAYVLSRPASALNWHPAPNRIEFGADMMIADVALSPDETLTLYAHRDALHLVPAALSAAEPAAVTDEMVEAYLLANDAYWRELDATVHEAKGAWRNGTPKEATRVSLAAALATRTPKEPTWEPKP